MTTNNKLLAVSEFSPIHRDTDLAAKAVGEFCSRHPEYGRLGFDVVEQAMATYRTDEEHETLRKLWGEGVPVGRRTRWSDETLAPLAGVKPASISGLRPPMRPLQRATRTIAPWMQREHSDQEGNANDYRGQGFIDL